jgi:hypothetical protein
MAAKEAGFDSQEGQCILHRVQTDSEADRASRLIQLGCEADISLQSNVEVENIRSTHSHTYLRDAVLN